MKRALLVVLAIALLFTLHQGFVIAIESTRIYQLQMQYLHWRYIHQAVFLIPVPVLALSVLHRKPCEYGLLWNRHVSQGIIIMLILTLMVPIAVDLAAGKFQLARPSIGYLMSTLVFQIVFAGCGEELFFRGMCQSETDRLLRSRLRIGRTLCGPGILVGAFFFGLGHLGISSAMKGACLNLGAFAATCVIGLALGFVREFVGSIFIVGFLHASINLYPQLMQPSIPGRVVYLIALAGVFYLCFSRRIHANNQLSNKAIQSDGYAAADL